MCRNISHEYDYFVGEIYVPMNKMVPICSPNDLVIGGWDINKLNLYQAMKRAGVLPVTLQQQLKADMEKVVPLPGLYYPDFIASNQEDRADHTIKGNLTSINMFQTIKEMKCFEGSIFSVMKYENLSFQELFRTNKLYIHRRILP